MRQKGMCLLMLWDTQHSSFCKEKTIWVKQLYPCVWCVLLLPIFLPSLISKILPSLISWAFQQVPRKATDVLFHRQPISAGCPQRGFPSSSGFTAEAKQVHISRKSAARCVSCRPRSLLGRKAFVTISLKEGSGIAVHWPFGRVFIKRSFSSTYV